jgi:hypothetical protein
MFLAPLQKFIVRGCRSGNVRKVDNFVVSINSGRFTKVLFFRFYSTNFSTYPQSFNSTGFDVKCSIKTLEARPSQHIYFETYFRCFQSNLFASSTDNSTNELLPRDPELSVRPSTLVDLPTSLFSSVSPSHFFFIKRLVHRVRSRFCNVSRRHFFKRKIRRSIKRRKFYLITRRRRYRNSFKKLERLLVRLARLRSSKKKQRVQKKISRSRLSLAKFTASFLKRKNLLKHRLPSRPDVFLLHYRKLAYGGFFSRLIHPRRGRPSGISKRRFRR